MGRQEPLLSYNTTRPSRTRGADRPVKGGLLSQLHNSPHHEPPSSPKLTPRKALLAIFLALLGLSLLHRPVSNRYNGVPRYGNGLRTPEERARHVLTTTPLIGMITSLHHDWMKTNKNFLRWSCRLSHTVAFLIWQPNLRWELYSALWARWASRARRLASSSPGPKWWCILESLRPLPSKRFRLFRWKLRCQWVHAATIHTRTFLIIYHRCSVYIGPDRCHD